MVHLDLVRWRLQCGVRKKVPTNDMDLGDYKYHVMIYDGLFVATDGNSGRSVGGWFVRELASSPERSLMAQTCSDRLADWLAWVPWFIQ
jgi:hypothetical protein